MEAMVKQRDMGCLKVISYCTCCFRALASEKLRKQYG